MTSRRYVVQEPEYRIKGKKRMRREEWDREITLPFTVSRTSVTVKESK